MFKNVTVGTKLCCEVQGPKAQFRRRTFHEPNLIPLNKHMKSFASESVKNGYFEFGTDQPFFPAGSAENFAFGKALIQMPNLSCAEPNA